LTLEKLALAFLLQEEAIAYADYATFKKGEGSQLEKGLPADVRARCLRVEKELQWLRASYNRQLDNPLLRAWEYTIASFSEGQSTLSRWNLYSSIGFEAEEEGGIGQCLYQAIQERISRLKADIERIQEEYDTLFVLIRTLETRLRTCSEKEGEWLKIDYQNKVRETDRLAFRRDDIAARARRLADSYQAILDFYLERFPDYFQEVYDPDIETQGEHLLDDSPAGFRLLYKHGRQNPSLWTRVESLNGYGDALASFFTALEVEMAPSFEGMEEDLQDLTTTVVSHVRSLYFLESAIRRMAKAHGQPIREPVLENLDRLEKKPWVYTSGGTMDHLVSAYFGLEEKPSQVSRSLESPYELMMFAIDTVKNMPAKYQGIFHKGSERSLLMHSPTHAFLLKPGFSLFYEAWHSSVYSSSWVGQYFARPGLNELESMKLTQNGMHYLFDQLKVRLKLETPSGLLSDFPEGITPMEFRRLLLQKMPHHQLHLASEIDAVLFSNLPLLEEKDVPGHLLALFERLEELPDAAPWLKEYLKDNAYPKLPFGVISSQRFRQGALNLLAYYLNRDSASLDYQERFLKIMRSLQLALSEPFLFADSNWSSYHFACLVSPGTGLLELWLVDFSQSEGRPMPDWFAASFANRTWGVYVDPSQYSRKEIAPLKLPATKGMHILRA
jgi:hypothetical protein